MTGKAEVTYEELVAKSYQIAQDTVDARVDEKLDNAAAAAGLAIARMHATLAVADRLDRLGDLLERFPIGPAPNPRANVQSRGTND